MQKDIEIIIEPRTIEIRYFKKIYVHQNGVPTYSSTNAAKKNVFRQQQQAIMRYNLPVMDRSHDIDDIQSDHLNKKWEKTE